MKKGFKLNNYLPEFESIMGYEVFRHIFNVIRPANSLGAKKQDENRNGSLQKLKTLLTSACDALSVATPSVIVLGLSTIYR